MRGDGGAGVVELGRAMGRFAEQHHAAFGEALGQARQLVEIAERLGRLGDEMAELGADGLGALRRHQQPGGEAGAFGVDLGLFLRLAGLDPAFGADQRHEGDGAVVLLLELVLADAADQQQSLMHVAADRDHQSAADGQLPLQGLGHFRAAGRDQDRVERRLVGQALGAVAVNDLGIGVAERLEALARLVGKLLVALDGIDLARDAAQHGGGIARAGAHFEHLVAGIELEQLDHAGDDVGLGDGLPRLDRQRRILIGELRQVLRHERLARHLAHGGEHQRVGDAARLKMPRHHDRPVARVAVVAVLELGMGGCHAD